MSDFLFGYLVGATMCGLALYVRHRRGLWARVSISEALACRLRLFMTRTEERLSQLSDEIAALGTTVTDAEARVSTDVQALRDRIAELEAIIAAGSATPEDIAALEALRQRIANIDPAIVSPTP